MKKKLTTLFKKKVLLFVVFVANFSFAVIGQNQKEGVQYSGNPILEGRYADPEVAIYDSLYWIFPTGSGRPNNPGFDAFSSPNLVTWTKHERILDSSRVKWIKKSLWAPATVKKDGKYYLFFSSNDIQSPFSQWWDPEKDVVGAVGGIGVAVADKPDGPYKDLLGEPLINEFYNKAQPIDQFVFKYTDGNYYIVYGGWKRCNIGILKNDFTALVPFADGDTVKEITPQGYVEGPVMLTRKGKVYFMWSEGDWGTSNYHVAYAIADSPLGPFKRLSNLLESDTTIATGPGHNSVLNIPNTDDWYIVYHRRPIPNLGVSHRVTCIDHLYFNEDGTIQPIKMTNTGVQSIELSSIK